MPESDYPEFVRQTLARVRGEIAEIDAKLAYHSGQIDLLSHAKAQANAVQKAILTTAEAMLGDADLRQTPSALANGAAATIAAAVATPAARPAPQPKQRQDRREVLLALLKPHFGYSLKWLSDETEWPASQVAKQLERLGDKVRKDGDLWYLSTSDPVPAKADDTEAETAVGGRGRTEDGAGSSSEAEVGASGGAGTAAPSSKSEDSILDFVRRCGDIGASDKQLELIGATEDQVDALVDAGQLQWSEKDHRIRIHEGATA